MGSAVRQVNQDKDVTGINIVVGLPFSGNLVNPRLVTWLLVLDRRRKVKNKAHGVQRMSQGAIAKPKQKAQRKDKDPRSKSPQESPQKSTILARERQKATTEVKEKEGKYQ